MATKTEKERLAVVETKLDDVIKRLESIDAKLEAQDMRFAARWVQQVVGGMIALVLTTVTGMLLTLIIRGK